MKFHLLITFILLLVAAKSSSILSEQDYQNLFNKESGQSKIRFKTFMEIYKKSYQTSQELYQSYLNFRQNEIHIINSQINDPKAQYSFTVFSDISPEEFQQKYLTPVSIDENQIPQQNGGQLNLGILDWIESITTKIDDLPKNFDWREKNVVSTPKAQFSCGSCWAFATTGVLESQYFLKHGKHINLSEQQLIDCDTNNKGCKGGIMTNAYKYLVSNGLETKETYGDYLNRQDKCRSNPENFVVKVSNYYQIAKDEKVIMRQLYDHGPIAVGINGEHLQFYDGGIFNPSVCSTAINHAVLIVGYGETEDDKTPYWIVKNQWGEFWGNEGYFKLIRGQNKCGINSYASIAFIE